MPEKGGCKHAMNICLSSLRIRAHLSWRTGKHIHVLHVLRTYSKCSYPGYQDTTTYAALLTSYETEIRKSWKRGKTGLGVLGNKSFLLLGNLRSLCAIFDRPISTPYHLNLKDHLYCLSWSRYFCLISLTINHLFNPYVIALYLCSSWILLVYVIERLKGNMAGVNESIDRWKSVEKGKSNLFSMAESFSLNRI